MSGVGAGEGEPELSFDPGGVVWRIQCMDITGQAICNWRKQEQIDTGQAPSATRAEQVQLTAAKQRIRELEIEVAILKRARELLKEAHDPKGGTRP